jgi:histidine phosphotransferase ChpT
MLVSAPLRVLELLAARLCHDLISPVAAIANGAELLGDDDPGFVRDAVALVGTSARNANARLQYFRFTYGFSGSGLAGPAPHQLAGAMLLVAGEALSRGGRLLVGADSGGPEIDAIGDTIILPTETRAALTRIAAPSELTTRTVVAYFTGLLAAAQGRILVVSDRPGGFRMRAPPR